MRKLLIPQTADLSVVYSSRGHPNSGWAPKLCPFRPSSSYSTGSLFGPELHPSLEGYPRTAGTGAEKTRRPVTNLRYPDPRCDPNPQLKTTHRGCSKRAAFAQPGIGDFATIVRWSYSG